ncbi:hypothetical protein Anas_03074, partial [Armadillidium nasatum]
IYIKLIFFIFQHCNQEIQFEDLKKGSSPKVFDEEFWSKVFRKSCDKKKKQFEDLKKGSCPKLDKEELQFEDLKRLQDEEIQFEDLKKKEKDLKECNQLLEVRMEELPKSSKKQIPPSSSWQISDSLNSFGIDSNCKRESTPCSLSLIDLENLYRNLGNTNKNCFGYEYRKSDYSNRKSHSDSISNGKTVNDNGDDGSTKAEKENKGNRFNIQVDQEQVKEENNEELENEDSEDDDSFTCSELSEEDEYSDTDSVTSAEREDKQFDDHKCDSDYPDSKLESISCTENDENDDDIGGDDSCKIEKENKEKRSNNQDNEEQIGEDEEKEESANENNKGDNSFNCSEFSEDDGSKSDSESEDKSFSENKCDDCIERPIERVARQTKNMVNEKPLGNVKRKENFGTLTRENEQLIIERIFSNLKPRQPLIHTAEDLMKLFLSDSDINGKANQSTSEACQPCLTIPEQPSDPVLSDSDLNAEGNHSNSKPSQPSLPTPEELINSLLSDSDESFDGEIIEDCDVPSLNYVHS